MAKQAGARSETPEIDGIKTEAMESQSNFFIALLKDLGFVYSDENNAWMHSEHGTGFTTQIDVQTVKRLHDAFQRLEAKIAEAREEILEDLVLIRYNHFDRLHKRDEATDKYIATLQAKLYANHSSRAR